MPSAAAIPTPPSFVALPPRHTTMRRAPALSAARDQLAGSPGRGAERVTPPLAEQRQPRRPRGFHDPCEPVRGFDDPERRVDRIAERARRGRGHEPPALRVDQRLQRPFASVGHRDQVDDVVGTGPTPAGFDRLGRLACRERAAELVGSHEDAHAAELPSGISTHHTAAERLRIAPQIAISLHFGAGSP